MKVGYIVKPDLLEPGVDNHIVERISKFLSPHCESHFGFSITDDVLLAFGGDGTVLAAIRKYAHWDMPVVGISCHSGFGYLTDFSFFAFENKTTTIVEAIGQASESQRVGLTPATDGMRYCEIVPNDVVIKHPYRMVKIDVEVDGQHLTKIRGDGLIIATPSGSTGYNLSAGGPILHPEIEAIILTPLAPHSITHKPIVLPLTSVIKVTVEDPTEVLLIFDGQEHEAFPQAGVSISAAEKKFRLLRNRWFKEWQITQDKLKWG